MPPKTRAFPCGLCEEPRDENMVACDLCSMLYHFRCVNVGNSIADRSWTCPGCNKELLATSTPVDATKKTASSRHSTISGISTTASVRAAKAALELQQLEERKALELKRIREEEARRCEEAELEKARMAQEKLQREKERELELRRLDEERLRQEQERLQREREADLERKRLEAERRQQEQEQALAKKKLDDEKARSEQMRKMEEQFLTEKYRILNENLEESHSGRSVDGAKALSDKQSKGGKNDRLEKAETASERLAKMRQEEMEWRVNHRKRLEQMGFVAKDKTLYAPVNQRAIDWVDDLVDEDAIPLPVRSVPLPMGNSGRERYTGTKPKPNRIAEPAEQQQHLYNDDDGSGILDHPGHEVSGIPRQFRQQPSNLPRIGEEHDCPEQGQSEIPRTIPRRPPRLPWSPPGNGQVHPGSNVREEQGLTKSQLAARQVLPKDLPSFSGNPEDWPVFISNYENSTAECGYSNAENLIRLQRCLKGDALEAVRSRLLLPAAVPRVIDTLQMLFGRPEILINSLLAKM